MNDFLELKIQSWLDSNHLIVVTKEAAKTLVAKCRDGAASLAMVASASLVGFAPTQVSAIPAASIPISEFQQNSATEDTGPLARAEEQPVDRVFSDHLADLDSLITKIGRRAFRTTSSAVDPLAAKAATAMAASRTQSAKDWATQLLNGASPI